MNTKQMKQTVITLSVCILFTLIVVITLIITVILKARPETLTSETTEVAKVDILPINSNEEVIATSTSSISTPTWIPDESDVELIAKTLWGECRGVRSKQNQAAVVWCILNRVDANTYYGHSIAEVITKPNQFLGYKESNPIDNDLRELAIDVLQRWHAEKNGEENVGRVLPKDYCFFVGNGIINNFTNEWKSKNYWDWSLPNPYTT